jgi:hypothetical protein
MRSPVRDVWLLFDCSLPAGAGLGAALSSLFSSSSDLRSGVAALASELLSSPLGRFARMPFVRAWRLYGRRVAAGGQFGSRAAYGGSNIEGG